MISKVMKQSPNGGIGTKLKKQLNKSAISKKYQEAMLFVIEKHSLFLQEG